MSGNRHVVIEALSNVREVEERRIVAMRHGEKARERSRAAAIRQGQLAQARADLKEGKHDVAGAAQAAIEALARSAAAHRQCAEAYVVSARLHACAARLADGVGKADRAARHREIAAGARTAAEQATHFAEEDLRRLSREDRATDPKT